jgi:hypothetical protein
MTPLDYSCDICHKSKHSGEKEMYMGIGGKGVESLPSPMFVAQVDCIGCHVSKKGKAEMEHFEGFTLVPSEDGCISCHGKDYKGMLSDWKSSLDEALKKTSVRIEAAKKILETAKGDNPNLAQAKKLYDDARHNFEFVKFSKGVHNVDYALSLLSFADQSAEKINSLLSQKKEARAKKTEVVF